MASEETRASGFFYAHAICSGQCSTRPWLPPQPAGDECPAAASRTSAPCCPTTGNYTNTGASPAQAAPPTPASSRTPAASRSSAVDPAIGRTADIIPLSPCTARPLSTSGHPGRDRTGMSWCNAGSPFDDNTGTGRFRSASPSGCRPEPMSECGGLRSLPPPFPSRLSSAPRCTPCKSDPSHCRHPC